MLHLRYGGDPRARNVLLWYDGELAGYGHLDPTDPVEGPAAEMVIDPASRRRGLGLDARPDAVRGSRRRGTPAVGAWGPAGGGPACGGRGLQPFPCPVADAPVTAGAHRQAAARRRHNGADVPMLGRDEDAWVSLNQRAFAHHPEQGAWTRADLDMREREPWFDPNGFFLAERDGRLVGFHWTKIHGGNEEPRQPTPGPAAAAELAVPGHGHEAIGEVYVVGVDPAERGNGLGRALTLIGLRYLRGRGLSQVMLYVDETNTAAIGLYESLGFTHWDTDVMFSRGASSGADS